MKKVLGITLSMTLAVSCLSGAAGVSAGKAARKPVLSQKKLTLAVGQKKTIRLKRSKIKKVRFSSSKKKVATVSKKGVVRAVAPGSARIVARYQGKKYVCRVKVVAGTASATANPQPPILPFPSVSPEETLIPKESQTPGTQASLEPSASSDPSDSVNPAGTTEPTDSVNPAGTTEPTDSGNPSGSQSPAQSMSPEESGKPQDSEPPKTSSPAGSDKPTAAPVTTSSAIPEITAKPSSTPVVNHSEVTMSQASGTYPSAFTLTLTSTENEVIYYTTDGSDPRTSDSRKTYQTGISIKSRSGDKNVLAAVSPEKIETLNSYISGNRVMSNMTAPSDNAVDKCTVVKAVSRNAQGNYGTVATNTYFIGNMSTHIQGAASSASAAGQKLAVISISMDQDDLFDDEVGIYARGKIFQDSLQEYIRQHGSLSGADVEHNLTSNFKQRGRDWERNAHIEYFETDGTTTTCRLQQDCGIRIQGNYSRENVQKSFRLYARDEYGKKNFKYAFFPDLEDEQGDTITKYKTLVLRNGGNDAFNYKFKDAYMQSFLTDAQCETLNYRPCVVYLDGEYWGYYLLQSDYRNNYLENKYGVDKDQVLIYKGSDETQYSSYGYKLDDGDLPEGVTDQGYYLRDMLDYLKTHDLSGDEAYQYVIDHYIDEQSALDYFGIMIYLNNGYDWPGKNWSIWKTQDVNPNVVKEDGKWRFCLYDLDLTGVPTWSGNAGSEWSSNNIGTLLNRSSANVPVTIFRNLYDSATFRQKLKDTLTHLANDVYTRSRAAELTTRYMNVYRPLNDQFVQRFNANRSAWSTGDSGVYANQDFLNSRRNYLNTLLSYIDSYSGSTNTPAPETSAEPIAPGTTLTWTGNWTKGGSSNVQSSVSAGMSVDASGSDYVQINLSDWSFMENPVLKVTVDDGCAADVRLHIWDASKKLKDQYMYQNIAPWVGTEISLESLRGNTFYINVLDGNMTKFEIYDKQ